MNDWPLPLDVSRETLDQLRAYHALLLKWTQKINLISRATMPDAWERHVVDSAQIAPLIGQNLETITDVGSGGGMPGVILSILRPDLRVTLVDSDQRKAQFLRQCVRELSLNAEVKAARIEDLPRSHPDLLTARALAPLDVLLGFALHLGAERAVFLKGAQASAEIEAAQSDYTFTLRTKPSITNPEATLIELSEIAHAR